MHKQLIKNAVRGVYVLVATLITDLLKDRYIGAINRWLDAHAAGPTYSAASWIVNRPFIITIGGVVVFALVLVIHAVVVSRSSQSRISPPPVSVDATPASAPAVSKAEPADPWLSLIQRRRQLEEELQPLLEIEECGIKITPAIKLGKDESDYRKERIARLRRDIDEIGKQIATRSLQPHAPQPTPNHIILKPNMICTQIMSAGIAEISMPGRYVKSEHGQDAVIAVIANDAGSLGAASVSGAVAQLVFREAGQEFARGFGTWLGEIGRYVNFDSGEFHELVLAVTEENAAVNVMSAVFNPRGEVPVFRSHRARLNWMFSGNHGRLQYRTLKAPLRLETSILDSDGVLAARFEFQYELRTDGTTEFTLL